jgi:acyl carrier protein
VSAAAEARSTIRHWLTAHARRAVPIDDDTPILELRVIDSLKVLELVLLIEELTGRPVSVEQLAPGSFRNVAAICATFFATDEAEGTHGR